MSRCIASERQLELSLELETSSGEISTGDRIDDTPVKVNETLMELIIGRDNLFQALRKVIKNGGSPGIDGLTVKELPYYLKENWIDIRQLLINEKYIPQAVKRVEIPKPGGGKRNLGIPSVVDRLIQQAIFQIIQPLWEPTFSINSFGFRPNRSAHQAVERTHSYIRKGYRWVIDLDLEKFFDLVNHDILMNRLKKRISDKRVLRLINRFLKSKVMINGHLFATEKGTPQGGPLSPLLSNILLDDFDKELERRKLNFSRYADDCNIYVKRRRTGYRIKKQITRFLDKKLKLKVNESKSAVDHPWNRTFLGFTFVKLWRGSIKRKVSKKSINSFKDKVRKLTQRTRGRNLSKIIEDLNPVVLGWGNYFKFTEVKTPFKELDSWIRRKLRCYQWKQWGRKGYRRLKELGVKTQLAWNTSKSAHGPWRLSGSPGICRAMPNKYFTMFGLISLSEMLTIN